MTNITQSLVALTFVLVASILPDAPRTGIPSISSLSPASAVVGANGVRLTVNGSQFARTSVVRWRGIDRPTTYISASQLQADVPAADLATPGTAQVTVFNQGGNGGLSNLSTFTVGNPLPGIISASPSPAMAGSEPFELVVTGSNFVSGTVVRWNGVARQTTFQSPSRVSASISAADVAATGTAQLTVFNPAPLGGSSTTMPLPIAVVAPIISSFAPPGAMIDNSNGVQLQVTGQNFARNAVVRWNGQNRATTWVSQTRIDAHILASDLDSLVPVNVTVLASLGATTRESAPMSYPLINPIPRITQIQPPVMVLGTTNQIFVYIDGDHFVPQSTVTFLGRPEARMVFYSKTRMHGYVTLNGTETEGPAEFRVNTPGPGGGSRAISITLRPPQPVLSSLNPQTRLQGGAAFTLVVTGARFRPATVVYWNGAPRPTTYVSATELRAAIPATDLARGGDASIKLTDPVAGSSAATLKVSVLFAQITIPD